MISELDFYAFYNISPIGLLSDCQYDNELRLGIEYGDDVCEYIQDETSHCKECEKQKQKIPYYPPITDDVIINILLICGTRGLDISTYWNKEHKLKILEFARNKSKASRLYRRIRDILIIHMQDYGRF